MAKHLDDLGDLQAAVMDAVWKLREATVEQVRREIRRPKRPAYTTVLTVMQKLEKAGWLDHRREGRAYVYCATRTRTEQGSLSLQRFVKRVFGGDAKRMLQHLLESEELSEADLSEIRKMIDRRQKEKR